MNRIDPSLFARCFESFVAAMWPQRHDVIAIDGKTARRTHDKRKGLKALHTLSAYATHARLVLGQLSVPEKTNEITAIPELLDTLEDAGQLTGALVTIDAMGCQVDIAQKIVDAKAHYVLALKGNQPTLEADVTAYFETAPAEEIVATTTVEKDHGRIETRCYRASANEPAGRISRETRTYISNAPLDIERLAAAIRCHWGVESMHWVLDVEFKDDLSRYRQGYGAKNMA